jgi:predicted lipoprotein with Yx(FWY)xxD motif
MRRVIALALVVGLLGAATAAARSHRQAGGPTVKTAFNKKLKAAILVTSTGLTLYYWTQDLGTKSGCVNDSTYHCSKWWPPLLTKSAPTAGAGARKSLLGTTKRADGTTQVTYAGHPVYRWHGAGSPAPDTKPGDTFGQGFISQWWALTPAGKPVKKIPK